MFRALARATMLMVVAPSAPVAWWPGAAPLTDALRRRLPRSTPPVRRATTLLTRSGREVVALPVEAGTMRAPWGEPVGVAGVVIRTSAVPSDWLRPLATLTPRATARQPASDGVVAGRQHVLPATDAPPRWQDQHRSQPTTAARFRRAAAFAVGLLVSLVAVEAAARAGRR